MEALRRRMSPEGADIGLDGLELEQLLLSGDDNTWLASSSPSFFASPSIFLSDSTTITATTSTCLSQPSITMESGGGPVDLDLDQLLSGDNPWLQAATNASSSTSFFHSPSAFPLLDGITSWGTPASSISATSFQGPAVDLNLLEQLFSGDNAWSEVAAVASSSPSSFACPSTFPVDATNTCLIQPSPSIPTTSSSPEGAAAVELDDLLDELLAGENAWPELASDASSSPTLLTSPTIFPAAADAEAHSGANNFLQTILQSLNARHTFWTRVNKALTYYKETQRDYNMLAQLSMPVITGDGAFELVSRGPPFGLDRSSKRCMRFREAVMRFLANAYSPSLPQSADWPLNLNSRSFTYYEISPIVNHAKEYLADPAGALRLLVFDKGNYSCLGVLELVITQEFSFNSGLDTICGALQALDILTTTHVSTIPRTKFDTASYEEAIQEILQVLRAACIIHKLPLAQTWVTCGQQGKWCRRHSDRNCRYCISTIDIACYVNDRQMQNFHYSCSDHHLLRGQGVVGKSFTTNQPCFLPDIGSSSEHEYPLSLHAKIFGLKGAVAIRLRCTHTGMADFVLEFFLPTDCEVENEQKTMMDSLWVTVQSLSKTLHMVTNKEMQDDATWEMNEINSIGLQKNKKVKKRKPMARRSPVWKSFTEVMVGDIVKAKCNHCGLELCCDSKNGTSSLISHLKRCKLNPNNRITGPL